MSDGNFQNKTYWENEKNGMIAVYNGSLREAVTEVSVTAPYLRLLYGGAEAKLTPGRISGWAFTGGSWGDTFFYPEETYAGGALGIKTEGNAHAWQTVENLQAGRDYTLRAYLRTVEGRGAIKAEFLNTENKTFYQNGDIRFYESVSGEWTEAIYDFTVPEGADSASFLLRVIGGGEVYWDSLTLHTGETETPLVNGDFETCTDGTLTIILPSETLLILGTASSTFYYVEKNNILYDGPVSGGTVRCLPDAVLAQYVLHDGKKELIGFFTNGDTMQDGEGIISFYRWDGLRPTERYVSRKTEK